MFPTPPPTPRAPARLRSEAGFTIIEVLVSALMVVLIGAATASALISSAHVSGDQRLRSQADTLAGQDQERLRGLSDEQLNGLSQTRTVTLGNGMTFSVNSASTFVDTTGSSSCTSSAAAYYRIVSTVTWTEVSTTQVPTLSEDSLLARPVTGDLMTQVNDETGLPLSGVRVTATGPSNQSGATDGNGCVTFAGLTPGSYAVALAAAGFVDPNGNASPPNMVATVTGTGTVATPTGGNPAFAMGRAGSIAGTFMTSPTGAAGEADAISWYGTLGARSMSAYQTTTPATAPGPPPAGALTTRALFPFYTATPSPSYANNYTVWAGRCVQQEPPAGTDQFTVKSGSIGQAQTVKEPLLDVAAVQYKPLIGIAAPVKPAHIKLTFTGTTGTPCSYSWYPTISSAATVPATGWLASPGQTFASTATTGSAKSASGQTGSLTMCADYNNNKAITTAFTNSSFTGTVAPIILITQGSNPGPC